MSWIYLILAGITEIFGVICMKKFALSNQKIYLLGIAALFVLSLSLLSLALREIPMGIGYAIWTGIETGCGVLVGIFTYKESKAFWKVFFFAYVGVCGIGLNALN